METDFSDYPLVTIESISEKVDFLEEVLSRLANKGIMTLFVEGGSRVHSSFINAGLADELYLYMAPKLIGNGASLFMDETRNFMAESESLRSRCAEIGEDIRFMPVYKGGVMCLFTGIVEEIGYGYIHYTWNKLTSTNH